MKTLPIALANRVVKPARLVTITRRDDRHMWMRSLCSQPLRSGWRCQDDGIDYVAIEDLML